MTLHPLRLTPGTDLRLIVDALHQQRGLAAAMVISGLGSLATIRSQLAGCDAATTRGGSGDLQPGREPQPRWGPSHVCVADGEGRGCSGHRLEASLVRTTAERLVASMAAWSFHRALDPQTGFRERQISRSDAGLNVDSEAGSKAGSKAGSAADWEAKGDVEHPGAITTTPARDFSDGSR